ncbi:MAG: GNAT family N-acetyltransferase [bacterium]|nr:GNAT family N-acetyltransferase [bacterium]
MEYRWEIPSLEDATCLAGLGFNREVDAVLTKDVRQHLATSDATLCIYADDRLIGYMLFGLQVSNLVYISGTLVHPEYQGMGIKALATRVAMKRFGDRTYFAGRTQSPIVWSSVTRLASSVYPHPSGVEPESHMAQVLTQLVDHLQMDAPLQVGFYGGPLYGRKPQHNDAQVQSWWDTLINFERGDALVYIAKL